MSQQQNNDMQKNFYRASAADFGKIPGSPIAYWVSEKLFSCFQIDKLRDVADAKQGMATSDNGRFLRFWHEVSEEQLFLDCASAAESEHRTEKWYAYNKGGEFRRWFGNNEYVVNWQSNGVELKAFVEEINKLRPGGRLKNQEYYFRDSITYSSLSSGLFSARYNPVGFLFDTKGSCIFPVSVSKSNLLGLLNSNVAQAFLNILCPTLDYSSIGINAIPVRLPEINEVTDRLIEVAKKDWDSNELSWDFKRLPLLQPEFSQLLLERCYQKLRAFMQQRSCEMQRLEEDNNRLFIEVYDLQDELTPAVPLSEITLTCNPHYRYGGNLTDEEREARLQSDTISELISYAIGCMMGRYSLDREGLVYAHAGNEGFKALVEEGAYATFAADEDGILPLTADNWFPDDVAARIEQFVRTVWGAETLEENLQFIADSLCLSVIKPVKKGGETARETIRRYLSTQFFKDHMKTYKKRPIYWLFSSGKEKAFECLVYLHRYNEATLPRMRTEYVTPLLGQMAGRIERLRLQQAEAGTAEAKRIGKEIDTLSKQLTELRAFDDELKHHADMRITLDLDDGVKVNYGKFGTLLSDVKAITGDKGE